MAEHLHDARRAALTRLFDDAAVFPPASRDLDDALAAHRGHHDGDRGWLVNHFLIRASQAADLAGLLGGSDQLRVGVILDGEGEDTASRVAADLAGLDAIARHPGVAMTDVEVRLREPDPRTEVTAIVAAIAATGTHLGDGLVVAVEVPVNGHPAGQVVDRLEAIAMVREAGGRPAESLIGKIRCGGVEAAAVPDDEDVAGFLRACANLGLSFKATAGLHHPTRTSSDVHGGTEHGFLNLLAAATAARGGAKLDAIEQHLGRPPEQFMLGPGALVVGDGVIEPDMIADVRTSFFRGIGCCDILDPVTDLARMGALTPTGGVE